MTGAAEGKIELKGAKVYIHVKGKARARITHIDIEHPAINKIIKPKERYQNKSLAFLYFSNSLHRFTIVQNNLAVRSAS